MRWVMQQFQQVLFCLDEQVLRPIQKLSAPRRVRPLIGVVFNQQKTYISKLHLYVNAPAQGPLSLRQSLIPPSLARLMGPTIYKRFSQTSQTTMVQPIPAVVVTSGVIGKLRKEETFLTDFNVYTLSVKVSRIEFFNRAYKSESPILNSFEIMDKQESFGDKLQQSEEEFQRQFDPSHPLYHGGVQQVVPIGGERIPESMPTVYPEGYDPNHVPEVINYGPEYAKVEQSRAVFQNLKKSLAKLGPIVEAFLRHEQLFKQKGDPTNEKHLIILSENIRKEKEALGVVQQELSAFIPELDSIEMEGKEVGKELFDLIKDSSKRYETKEELTDFNFKSKKLSTRVFALAQKCLQKLKDIKKNHMAAK